MKLLIIGAAIGATLIGALPAAAQVVIRERGDIVIDRDNGWRGRHYGWYRGHHYGWRNHYADCRTVRVRTRLPNGDVVIRTRRVC